MMRGRNRTVALHSFEIWGCENAHVDFYSKRRGKMPPVKFDGDVNELIDLFEEIVKDLRFREKVREV